EKEKEKDTTNVPEATTGLDETAAFGESPMLAELVAGGSLPTVEERLPLASDIMVESMNSLGTYGGTLNRSLSGAGSKSWATGKPIEEGLFRFKEDGTVEPNVAKGYDVNDDATLYTIYLREGIKWSDGVDFTTDDVIFFYEHMCLNETFGKTLWDCFKAEDGSIAKFNKVDDYTFTVAFDVPRANFIENVAINAKWLYAPAHYHREILAEFIGADEAEKVAQERGFADAATMGQYTGYYFWNVPGLPTLNSFVLSEEEGKGDVNSSYFEFVRNPYYFKTDSEGNQLPYIDKIAYTLVSSEGDQELLNLLDGTSDLMAVAMADIATVQEAKTINVNKWFSAAWSNMPSELQLNQTTNDMQKRELFQSKDFRQALSIGVNRTDVAALLTEGWVEGAQASPQEGMLGYSKSWKEKWTEYDVDKAKSLLEGLGLVMGSDGFYDFADGTDLVIDIKGFTSSGANEAYAVLEPYFKGIGVRTTFRDYERATLENDLLANDYDCILGPVSPASTISIILRPDTLVPVRNFAAWYGQVGEWYATKGASGFAPTGDLLELCNLYDQLKAAVNEEDQIEIAKKMLKLHEDNTWIIGYVGTSPTYHAVNKRIQNFPVTSIWCDEYRDLGIAHIQTWYIAE
ncbi:MAG: ABC transporter substrate-binding protein, partial [Anaerolineaceae bacterium]